MTHCPAAQIQRRENDSPVQRGHAREPMTLAAARRDDPTDLFATPAIVADRRADGSIVLKSSEPLRASARCVGDWLEHWGRQTPERIFLAERGNVDALWT